MGAETKRKGGSPRREGGVGGAQTRNVQQEWNMKDDVVTEESPDVW